MKTKITKSRGGWPDWIESEEGKRTADISTLPFGVKGQEYLENRLWAAFVAGAKYERDQRREVVEECCNIAQSFLDCDIEEAIREHFKEELR